MSMNALEMEKAAVCSSFRLELINWEKVQRQSDRGPIRASAQKIQAYCDRLDEIERLEQKAA